jgi:hypothetical protein
MCRTGHLHAILKGNPFLSFFMSPIFPSKNCLVLGQWNLGENFVINVFSLTSLVARYLKLWQNFLSWIKLPNEIQPSHHLNLCICWHYKTIVSHQVCEKCWRKRSFQIGLMLVRLCLHFHVAHYLIVGCYNVDHELDTTYLARMSILPTKSLKFYPHL